MSSNYFASGTTDKTIEFGRAVKHLNIFVSSSTTFSISFDGTNYMTLPSGFSTFPVGLITEVWISSTGAWQLIAVEG